MSLTRSLTRPITQPLTRALSAAGVGGLPLATHYVSQTATNGYAVGVNSGTGTTKAAPWLTIDYAIANAPTGSVIYINDGTYQAATTFFNVLDKALTFVSPRRRQVTVQAQNTQSRIFNLSSTLDRAWAFYGIVFDGRNDTDAAVSIGSGAIASLLSVSLIDCALNNNDQRLILSNSQKRLNLNIRGCEATSTTWAGLNLVQVLLHEAGAIDINGLTVNGAMSNTSTKVVVNINSVTGNSTAAVRNVGGTVTTASTAGGLEGVRVVNIDNAVIGGNSLNISGPALGAAGTNYTIYCDNAALSANDGIIEGNTGSNLCNGGYFCLYGRDGSTVGNDLQNNGTIRNNVMEGNPDATSPMHGYMLGYGIGGVVHDNTSTGAGLALIAKQQTGGEFYGNTVDECNSEAIRAKGATDTVFRDNTVNLSASFAGDCVAVDANDAPVTNSTGVEITENVFNIAAAPTNIVRVDVGSDAAFTGNTYNITTALGADSWEYQGTAYQTLEAWKAAVEPTAQP